MTTIKHKRLEGLKRKITEWGNVSLFAKEMGVDRVTVCRWISGTSLPDLDILRKAAKLFECRVSDILGE